MRTTAEFLDYLEAQERALVSRASIAVTVDAAELAFLIALVRARWLEQRPH